MRKITQTQIVIDVMRNMGGYATLGDLYREVLQVKGVRWNTKTPDATIRRIVQDERYFHKIRTGLWAMNECRGALPDTVTKLDNEVNLHSFNQGLLIDSGNFLGYKTYVPAQDQNRRYLNKSLKEMAHLIELPNFTYTAIVNRIKSIDVIWLEGNEDTLYPKSIFEVENSTDFTKSLNKFNELSHFSLDMIVVAPEHKEKQFHDTISWDIYRTLKQRVKFWDYNKLEQSHSQFALKKYNNLLF